MYHVIGSMFLVNRRNTLYIPPPRDDDEDTVFLPDRIADCLRQKKRKKKKRGKAKRHARYGPKTGRY